MQCQYIEVNNAHDFLQHFGISSDSIQNFKSYKCLAESSIIETEDLSVEKTS